MKLVIQVVMIVKVLVTNFSKCNEKNGVNGEKDVEKDTNQMKMKKR